MGALASRLLSTLSLSRVVEDVFVLRQVYSLPRVVKGVYFVENKSVASYMGWHGVGVSMAAKAVAEAAKESKLFEVVVLVRAGDECNPRKLQTRIAKQLEIIHDDSEEEEEDVSKGDIDEKVARKIYQSLGGRNFLLIIDNLLDAQGIKLVSLGVPTHQEWYRYKIFITTPNWEVISAMNSDYIIILSAPRFEAASPPSPVKADIMGIGGVDELLEHFRDEAGDVADAVSNYNAIGDLRVQVSRDEVFDCFIYLCLLQKHEANEKELMKYYVGGGLIRGLLQDHKEKDDLEAAFKVGQALLGEMFNRWMVERSSPDDDGKISVSSRLWKILEKEEGIDYLKQSLHVQLDATHVLEHDVKWMALLNNNNIQTLLLQQQLSYKNPQLTTLLLNDNPHLAEIPDNFFLGIPNLEVLDLSRTSISSLPLSLSCLVHLRFLKLRECLSLNSLPPTLLKDLKQLIILDLYSTPITNISTEACEQMLDLRLLDLSRTNMHSLPSSLFSSLCNLEQLFLRGCGSLISSSQGSGRSLQTLDLSSSPQLKSLPTSIINSSSRLKKLMLADCNALEEVMPSQLISQLSALEELDISGCGALKGVENASFEDMPKLRAVNLSNTKFARLSFARCRNLEIVRLQGLANLKSLHLSSLKMEEFPCEISELKSLEKLRLTDVPHLDRVEWKKVDWLPKRLEWDQCGCSTASALLPEELSGNRASSALISVSNANIFRGLATDSPIWGNCFSKFHIYICPCWKQNKEKEKEKAAVVDVKRRKPRAYAGIHSRIDGFKKDVEGLSRHLKIEGVDSVLHRNVRSSIKRVAGKAEGLYLHENGFVKSLSDVLALESDAICVKECRVERCHNMNHLFPEDMPSKMQGLKGRLWVSDMARLSSVFDGNYNFTHLKHLHIECCPKLDKLFGRFPYLYKLETLHIRFCARLEQVHQYGGAFPELRSLQLWELPKLKGIWGGPLPPGLEKLRVRACPKLQRLPYIHNPKGRLKIEGESDWWTNLNWDTQGYVKKEAINFKTSNANNP